MVARPEEYEIERLEDPEIHRVRAGDGRLFLVMSFADPTRGGPRTLVFEAQAAFWISRRDVPARLAPAEAAGGWLLGGAGTEDDPLARLRKEVETARQGYWQLLQADQKFREERLHLLEEIDTLRRERDLLKTRRAGPGRRRKA